MRSTEQSLSGVLVLEPEVFEDDRGFFLETFHREKYTRAGIDRYFVQDNHSHSRRGTLRGLHYQLRRPQAKLVYVPAGEIFDVAVDIRRGSATFGRWTANILSSENKRQLFVPEGFAHGFCVLSEAADVFYKCTDFYDPEDSYGIAWSDPGIGIPWPVERPMLSEKDQVNPELKDIRRELLPLYSPLPAVS